MPDLLPIVAGSDLPDPVRAVIAPGEEVQDAHGHRRVRPFHFYRVESCQQARELELAPFMSLWELISVDVREHPAMRAFPRFVPCAVTVLAAHLSALRQYFGTYLHVSANGGYRSPSHDRGGAGTLHAWGTAADIYRIGDDYLDEQETIETYRKKIEQVMPALRCKPFGHDPGETDDHLHVDLGYLVVEP